MRRKDGLVLLQCVCYTLLATTGLSTSLMSVGQTICEGGPGQPCYRIAYFQQMSSRVAFWEARQACEVDGGTLLSVESPAEQRHIEYLLQELSSASSGPASHNVMEGDFWIGLTREEEPQESNAGWSSCPSLYRWTDGSTAQFRNWYYDEPSCGGEACVVMYHQPTALHGLGGAYLYQWNDDRCNMKHNFICKYKPGRDHNRFTDKPGPWEPDQYEKETEVLEKVPEEDPVHHVVVAGPSGLLLVYVIIPTIPLLLLILVASGTCCFQMFSKSTPRTKTTINQSTLWISKAPKAEGSMEV